MALVHLCRSRVSGRPLQSARADIWFPAFRNWRICGPLGAGEVRVSEAGTGEFLAEGDRAFEVRAGEVRLAEVRG
jgi:hypothetical protein